ncbi:MAG: hypothetical protein NT051_02020 [Candidatus Micrarchaeota archaeon]|nr:hypothetical protein [Candidatus Micrarchaeota archaeon]
MDYFLCDPAHILSCQFIFAALAIAVSITALSYMAGKFFSMPSLEAFSKVELTELAVTVIIILISIGLIGGAFDLISSGFAMPDQVPRGGTAPVRVCPEWLDMHGPYNPQTGNYANGTLAFAQAHYFLGCRMDIPDIGAGMAISMVSFQQSWDSMLGKRVGDGVMMPVILSSYLKMMRNEVVLSFLSTLDFGIGVPLDFGVWLNVGGIMPFGGLNIISETNIFVVDALAATWSAFVAQKMLLQFIESAVLRYFLPLGLFMRAFPFSRRTGSTIIAICFAAYFIYPLTILVNQRMYEQISNPSLPADLGAIGAACSVNGECRTGRCIQGKCANPITEYADYESTFSICHGGNLQSVMDSSRQQTLVQGKYLNETDALSRQYQSRAQQPGGKVESRINDGVQESVDMQNIETGMRADGNVLSLIMTAPYQAVNWAEGLVENGMTNTGKLVVLAVIFIVMEIIITITLMKDFAILIGGEPRIFGLSKLV